MCDAQMGGGALNLVGSVVDLVSFLLQQQAVRVHGVLRSYTKTTAAINGIRQITAPDFCNFQMELSSGTLVTVALHSHTVPAKSFSQEVLVYGSKGHLVVRGGDLFVLRRVNQKRRLSMWMFRICISLPQIHCFHVHISRAFARWSVLLRKPLAAGSPVG